MKTTRMLMIGAAIAVWPLYAEQAQPAVKRHPGEHLHYNVKVADGDIDKIVGVNVNLNTDAPDRPDLPNAGSQFGGRCQKSDDPKVWKCDVLIPDGIKDGNYKLFKVSLGTPNLGKEYVEDFHVPVVPIENPNKFTPPSRVTVTEPP